MAELTSSSSRREMRIRSSNLYRSVPPSKVALVYSAAYNISFLGIEKLHPFDSSKWGRIHDMLVKKGILDPTTVVEADEATKEDLLVVHTESYLNSLRWSAIVAAIIEVAPVALLPNFIVQRKVLYPFRKQVGGTVLAGKLAIERGWSINLGGGFHHCWGNEGAGFCAYADISLCIHFAFCNSLISSAMIIDLDAHQGNGHERDFTGDDRVYILDMYNSEIYPYDLEAKKAISQNVELRSGTTTEQYLERLRQELKIAKRAFKPQLIVYNAGTDILDGDPLGRMLISPDGVRQRDEMVFQFAKDGNIPIVMLTSGGYMKSSAQVIADSIENLKNKGLIDLKPSMSA